MVDNCNDGFPSFDEFFNGYPRWANIRRFEPHYSMRADYNTNAKSYYDYLARFPWMFKVIQDVENRLLARNIETVKTLSINLKKIGDWIGKDDPCCLYDDVIKLQADVIISALKETITLANIKGSPFDVNNGTKIVNDGVWSPDYENALGGINNTVGDINKQIGDIINNINDIYNKIENINSNLPKGMTTTVYKELWGGEAEVGETMSLSDSIYNFDAVRIKYNIGGAQGSIELIPVYFKFDSPNFPTLSGTDYSSDNKFEGALGCRATNATGNVLENYAPMARLSVYDMANGASLTSYTKGSAVKGKVGSPKIERVDGAKYVKYS